MKRFIREGGLISWILVTTNLLVHQTYVKIVMNVLYGVQVTNAGLL